jgi:hypothetical protein
VTYQWSILEGNSPTIKPPDLIRQVLESKEFVAWTPNESVRFDLKASTNLTLGFILSCGVSAVLLFGIQGSSHDFSKWMPTLFSLLGGTFFLYIILFGIGGSRSVAFDRTHIEITSNSGMPLRSPWNEVISVRKIWIGGYEIRTRRGSATIWWWILPLWEDGYNRYLFEVFKALNNGYDNSKMKRYRPPVFLERGGNYTYDIPVDWDRVSMISTAIASPVFAILGAIHDPTKAFTTLAILSFAKTAHSFAKFINNYTPQKYYSDDKVMVTEKLITVLDRKGSSRAPFHLYSGRLLPTYSPKPFKGCESYGDIGNTVDVDRRFLVKIYRPLQPPVGTSSQSES